MRRMRAAAFGAIAGLVTGGLAATLPAQGAPVDRAPRTTSDRYSIKATWETQIGGNDKHVVARVDWDRGGDTVEVYLVVSDPNQANQETGTANVPRSRVSLARDLSTASLDPTTVDLYTRVKDCSVDPNDCTSTKKYSRTVTIEADWDAYGTLGIFAYCEKGIRTTMRIHDSEATGTLNGDYLGEAISLPEFSWIFRRSAVAADCSRLTVGDNTGDMWRSTSFDGDFVPAPRISGMDYVRARFVHAEKRVIFKGKFVELRRPTRELYSMYTAMRDQDGKRRVLSIAASRTGVDSALYTWRGKALRCDVRHAVNYRRNTIRLGFPRRCFDTPRTIQFHAGSSFAPRPRRDAFFVDDLHSGRASSRGWTAPVPAAR